MSVKNNSKWNVYAVVNDQPIAIQNKAPLTHWNAMNMARRLEKDTLHVSRVLVTRHQPTQRELITVKSAELQEAVLEA